MQRAAAERLPAAGGRWRPGAEHAGTDSHTHRGSGHADAAAPCACTGNLYNCGEFATQAAAQGCFDWCMQEVGMDVHRLDSDGDGIACESLPLEWRVVGSTDLSHD